jgi:hypothetical protein
VNADREALLREACALSQQLAEMLAILPLLEPGAEHADRLAGGSAAAARLAALCDTLEADEPAGLAAACGQGLELIRSQRVDEPMLPLILAASAHALAQGLDAISRGTPMHRAVAAARYELETCFPVPAAAPVRAAERVDVPLGSLQRRR